ncbi:MAG: DUF1564 domain-containing protein [Leptospira sp.]|nr:DUF1564 domain-containing protein [Leptospira sp.]
MKKIKSAADVRSFSIDTRLFHELSTGSDFGIPMRLVPGLKEKLSQHKNLRLYLSFLLNRLRSHEFQALLPVFIGSKIAYQQSGQVLEYFQFRPYVKDWMELMLIAKARGGSATLLFVILLELDLSNSENSMSSGEFKISGGAWLPILPIRFFQSLNLRTGLWRRSLKFGRSSYHVRYAVYVVQ